MERVVITGMGAITPVGNDVPSFWESLKTGKCGIGPITKFDVSDFKVKLGAEVKDFDPTQYMEKREARRADANVHYAMAAAVQAVEQAGLKEGNFDPYRTGVIFGSGVGGLHVAEQEVPKLLEKGPGRVSPFAIPEMIANIAAAYISMHFGFKGENFCPVSACATGNHSIGEAMRAIRHGYADAALVGGSEESVSPICIAGFTNLGALSRAEDPTQASLPFDVRRKGFVAGEGAGALVIESLEHALKRGATPIAEITGYGSTGDAYHMTAPDPEGAGIVRSMRQALEEGGFTPADIGHVNAHGTGTPANDKTESIALYALCDDDELAAGIPVTSIKGTTGHTLGAAGAVEAIVCALSVARDCVPPTTGFAEADPECAVNVVTEALTDVPQKVALSNSLGFGGHNATLAFSPYE